MEMGRSVTVTGTKCHQYNLATFPTFFQDQQFARSRPAFSASTILTQHSLLEILCIIKYGSK
jgi:hypothetical protein